MLTKAVVVAFHNYCWTMNHRYFDMILDYFMKNFKEVWGEEVDMLYLIDSTWGIDPEVDLGSKVHVIKVPENLRYYDAYKQVLPDVKEDAVLFMDNDMVVYRKGIVANTFKKLEEGYDVVSIYDTIGRTFPELGGKSKFCPYWFATKTKTLMNYRYVEWGPNMPEHETLGALTYAMLGDGLKPFEIEEDKTVNGKDLGYYHIRAGSVPAYLLTTKHFGDPKTYWEYINNQPTSETLRQCNWYDLMGGNTVEIRKDLLEKENLSTN